MGFMHLEEPHEAFFKEIENRLLAAARFLDRRPTSLFDHLRKNGLKLRIFIDVWMNQDQMEPELPCEFLAACAKHGLRIYVMSNDISAAEAGGFVEFGE